MVINNIKELESINNKKRNQKNQEYNPYLEKSKVSYEESRKNRKVTEWLEDLKK